MDYIVRAVAADKQIRAFAITSREMVETARQHHNTSPVATAALGRLLTGGAMMGVMMKGEKDMLTLMMKGDGPINGVTVTADSKGNVCEISTPGFIIVRPEIILADGTKVIPDQTVKRNTRKDEIVTNSRDD